ncbi:MAG TPA: DUF167 domain-containing protein [Desulfosarcina sp.]|nr:DUF167 domain-containing protein [Desulfosarcina sp.]
MPPFYCHDHPEGLIIDVRVQPKSAQNTVAGVHDGALKIKLNAPPVEGRANKALVQFLAKWLRRPKSSIEIVSGQTSRNKRLLVRIDPGPDFTTRREALKAMLQHPLG